MTIEKLQELFLGPVDALITKLQVSSFSFPKWSDLVKQFDPMKHNIWNEALYPKKVNEDNVDDFKRTSLALQELAVSRISQAMFSSPVTRSYKYDVTSESQKKAVDLIEQIYVTDNHIDTSDNMERAKMLNATCQVVTIWKILDIPTIVEDVTSSFKLIHRSYSEQDGYKIWAQTDPDGYILVVTIWYKDTEDVEHMDIYVNQTSTTKPMFKRYDKLESWTLNTMVTKELEFFPVLYAYIKQPVWGGESGTVLVEQLEEMESYQGMYIKRNSLPTFVLDYGDTAGTEKATVTEKSNDTRKIIVVGKGGTMSDVTWEGAVTAVTARYARLRNSFFEQVQMPDISFANLINSNTSAENKELLFSDAKAKAHDLGGEWEKFFYEEMLIVKSFLKIMFPSMAADLDLIRVTTKINPYSVKSKKEVGEYVSLAGDSMSIETKVRLLNEVEDVPQEVALIQEEQQMSSNSVM
jgi:hypothetical protein